METLKGLRKGDRLFRNSYSIHHFTEGRTYEVETIVGGYPRVLGDNGYLVTLAPPYSGKYFDLVPQIDLDELEAGTMVQFTNSRFHLKKGKTYFINKQENGRIYVYGENGKAIYLTNGFNMKVIGKLSDLKGDGYMNRLANQVKVGDVIKRIKPGGRYHAKGFTYKVTGIDNDGTVFVNTDQGFNRSIKPDSEKNWEVVPQPVLKDLRVRTVEKTPIMFPEYIEELDQLIKRTTEIRTAIKNAFKDMGMDETTAKAATEQVIIKGLSQK